MIKYCPQCHQEAYRLIEDKENIKVMQGRGTILNIGKSSSVSMNISCLRGHPVKLEIKPEKED